MNIDMMIPADKRRIDVVLLVRWISHWSIATAKQFKPT
jgi:hypothetical protein